MKVLVVDDHPMICAYLSAVLGRALAGAVVHIENDLAGALTFARCTERLGLVLLDLRLPGCTGIEALTQFRREVPDVPVVVVSMNDDRASILGALNAGAVGYIPKSSPLAMVIAALRQVAAGGTYVPREVLGGALTGSVPPLPEVDSHIPGADLGLTERLAEVLGLLLQGLPNKRIARRLEIADDTVKQHVSAIYKSLGVSSRTEAFITAARHGKTQH